MVYIFRTVEIKKISINSKHYPAILRKIKEAPRVLYYKGKIKPEEKCLAVVGTRRYSPYGKQAALEIAGDLAEAGLTIVSGLAPGIDTFAHTASVERGKRTIAVLGTGLDKESIYPQSNLRLAQRILEAGGCLISEYPPGTRGTRFTFPRRNRIVSGLSLGVLVIEAKERSGSLITARLGREQKRKIFALPGPVYSPNSRGTHKLIKEGAMLIENAEDILKEINIPRSTLPSKHPRGGDREESLILESLKEGPLYVDDIIRKTKLATSRVASLLSVLEIRNKIRNLGENVYALKG